MLMSTVSWRARLSFLHTKRRRKRRRSILLLLGLVNYRLLDLRPCLFARCFVGDFVRVEGKWGMHITGRRDIRVPLRGHTHGFLFLFDKIEWIFEGYFLFRKDVRLVFITLLIIISHLPRTIKRSINHPENKLYVI